MSAWDSFMTGTGYMSPGLHTKGDKDIKKTSSLTDIDTILDNGHPIDHIEGTQEDIEGNVIHGVTQERIANMFQRTYYTEHEKLSRGQPAEHPILNADIRHEDSEVFITGELLHADQSENPKTWDDYFDILVEQLHDPEKKVATPLAMSPEALSTIPEERSPYPEDDEAQTDPQLPSFVPARQEQGTSGHPFNTSVGATGIGKIDKEHSAKGGSLFGNMDWNSGTAEGATNEDMFVIPEDADDDFVVGLLDPQNTPGTSPPEALGKIPDQMPHASVQTDTVPRPVPTLISVSAKSYLGDELSHHQGGVFSKDMFSRVPDSMKRVHSMSKLDRAAGTGAPTTRRPCLLPMPGYVDPTAVSSDTPLDLSTLLQSIPNEGWILPYIIAGAVLLSETDKTSKKSATKFSNVAFRDRSELRNRKLVSSMDDMQMLASRRKQSTSGRTLRRDISIEELKDGTGTCTSGRPRTRSDDEIASTSTPPRLQSVGGGGTRIGSLFHIGRHDDVTLDDSHYQPSKEEIIEQEQAYSKMESRMNSHGSHRSLFQLGRQKAEKPNDLDDSRYRLTPAEVSDLDIAKTDYVRQLSNAKSQTNSNSTANCPTSTNKAMYSADKECLPTCRSGTGDLRDMTGSHADGEGKGKHEEQYSRGASYPRKHILDDSSVDTCRHDSSSKPYKLEKSTQSNYKSIFSRNKPNRDDELDDSHIRDKDDYEDSQVVSKSHQNTREYGYHSRGLFRRKPKDDDLDDNDTREKTSDADELCISKHSEKSSYKRGIFRRSQKEKEEPHTTGSPVQVRDLRENITSMKSSSTDNFATGNNDGQQHPVGLLGGLLQRIRSHDDQYNSPDDSVHGDLVLSHDKDGVYLTSKPDHTTHSKHSAPPTVASLSPSNDDEIMMEIGKHSELPKFMQFLFLFPNFHRLGTIFACKNPPWGEWERRRFFLWDNYIFEALADDDGMPIGYANLSAAKVAIHRDKRVRGRSDAGHPQDPDYMIRLQYYCSTDVASPKEEIFLCSKNRTYTDEVFQRLILASKMTVKDVYAFEESRPPLGIGRYAFVHRAVNRRLREKIVASSSDSDSDVAPTGQSPLARSSSYFSRRNYGSDNKLDRNAHMPYSEGDLLSNESLTGLNSMAGQCALKLINKREFWSQVNSGKERKDTLVREVLAQSQLINAVISAGQESIDDVDEVTLSEMELPVVQLNGIMETRENFVIDMELMKSNNLFDKLSEEGAFKEKHVKHIAIQLVQAVALCQANHIAHRDIKLSNITFPERMNENLLLSRAKHPPMQIKLADFGMAGFLEKDGCLRGRCGTPGYVAPEIFRSGVREGYSLNVDMFSVGVCLYSLLCGYEPFQGETIQDIINANKSLLFTFDSPEWSRVSDEAIDFVYRAMSPSARDRLTVHEALDHPWMNHYAGTINYPPKFKHTRQNRGCVVS